MRFKTDLRCLSAIVAVMAGPAFAADMDAIITAPEQIMQPVEIGSGWYLRGDISYNFGSDVDGKISDGLGNSASFTLDTDQSSTFSAGVGYQFNDWLRGDVTYGYERRGVEDFDEKLRIHELMANGYVDLGTFVGVTPYLGAGIGGANLSAGGDDTTVLAWALMAGVSYDVTSNVKVDLGYRFQGINSGFEDEESGLTVALDDLYSHQIRAGVRITTW
ncbi:MAG: outer membrane protein [Phyllobacterium sp.]